MSDRLLQARSALLSALERLRPAARRSATRMPDTDGNHRRLSAAALAALGLEQQPFRDRVPPAELFTDDTIEMQLNVLAEHLRAGEVLPVLRGESGSGKTAIIILLLQRMSREQHVFVARGDSHIRATRVVTDMLRILTTPIPDTPAECYRELCRLLGELTANHDQPAVLVVDDADRLPESELQNILTMHDHLHRALDGRFRLLLAADPFIEHTLSRLESRQISSGAVSTAGVRPLNRARIPPYIAHKLSSAGSPVVDALTDEAFDRIAREGVGLPRAVESAAARELEYTHGK